MAGALCNACTSQHKCFEGPGAGYAWLLLLLLRLDFMAVVVVLCMAVLWLLLHCRCCWLVQQSVEIAKVWQVTVLQGAADSSRQT
jgi:hypothetical protein